MRNQQTETERERDRITENEIQGRDTDRQTDRQIYIET